MAIFGTNGNDNLPGTAGADLFIASGGNDFLDGRGGNDTVSYANWSGPVTVALGMNGANGSANKYIVQWIFGQPYTWYNSTDTLRSVENVIGSRFNDTITGNELDNILTGLGGGIRSTAATASTRSTTPPPTPASPRTFPRASARAATPRATATNRSRTSSGRRGAIR